MAIPDLTKIAGTIFKKSSGFRLWQIWVWIFSRQAAIVVGCEIVVTFIAYEKAMNP